MSQMWPLVPLGDVLQKSNGWITLEPDRVYREVTVRLWGKGVTERRTATGAEIAAGRRLVVRSGQFILSRIDARNGAFGLVPETLDGAVVSNDFPVFTPNTAKIIPTFLSWMSKTSAFVDLCCAASEGTTNRVRLKEDRFLSMPISLPPLAKQRRIVARIEALAAKVEEARGLRQRVEQATEALIISTRAGLFQDAARQGTERLDEMVILERGKFSHRPRNEPRFFGGQHPWIQIAEIESSGKYIRTWHSTLNDDGLAISRKFRKGTVLISIAATIGAVGILDFDCCIPDSIVAATPIHTIESEYVYHYFAYIRTHLKEIAPQSAQKNVNLEILSSLPIPSVTWAEQHHIVAYLDEVQAKVDAVKRLQSETSAELEALMPSILDRAFRGEL